MEKAGGPGVLEISLLATSSIGLTGRGHPPEICAPSIEVGRQERIQSAHFYGMSVVRSINVERSGMNIDRRNHIGPRSEGCGTSSNAGVELENSQSVFGSGSWYRQSHFDRQLKEYTGGIFFVSVFRAGVDHGL